MDCSYPPWRQAVALDVLGRVERAGCAIADVLILCPAALDDLRWPRALRRWAEWRDASPIASPILSDVWWSAIDELPAAAVRLEQARVWWRAAGLRLEDAPRGGIWPRLVAVDGEVLTRGVGAPGAP